MTRRKTVKLTQEQCNDIRAQRILVPKVGPGGGNRKSLRPKMTMKALAEKYGVSVQRISTIINGPKPPKQPTETLKLIRREQQLQRKYGLTLNDYTAMEDAQNKRCAICGITVEELIVLRNVQYFDVDHCHITGAIRGLLCNHCNVGLGRFNDDPKTLTKAIEYLQNFNTRSEI